MKNLMKFMMLPALLLAASACSSNDDPVVDNGTTSEGDVYMTFTLVNTSDGSSRSETNSTDSDSYGSSDAGIEYGTDAENTISSVNIFLITTKELTIDKTTYPAGHTVASATNVVPTSSSNKQTYVASFKGTALSSFVGTDVNVMVYCNMSDVTTYGADLVRNGQSWGTEENAGKAGYFQMTNANNSDWAVTLPSDFKPYSTEANPFNLGTINVERSAARIDLKQGGTAGDNKFELTEVTEGKVTLEFQKIALINMSNNWYAYRRVVADNSGIPSTSTPTLCGTETKTNWVVDTDWSNKIANNSNETDVTKVPFSYAMEYPETWVWNAIPTSGDDNDNTWNTSGDYNDYYVWRYLNENTIPGVSAQKKGVTTGIVFKAQITATQTDIVNAMNAKERLYVFQNTLYGNWDRVVACTSTNPALQVAVDNSYIYYNNEGKEISEPVYDTATETYLYYDETGTQIAAPLVDADKAAAAGFTGYSADTDGKYYCYYYYWNRHNDNGDNTTMGVMEFAVVRNNVYKLCVNSVSKFGHPTPGGKDPDPDPEDPDDPDEEDEVYFQVSLKVLPWVVRINNIDF
ncbi:MAG: Mfa1 family fimbria major subunit [Bacteroidales bacterium]|nr:Mfa1 family fimbria major subunit [Bacteroidales bacterium]